MRKLEKVELINLNEAYGKVMHWFFSYPSLHIGLSDLAKELKISKKTATQIVSQLISEGFLIKEEVGRAWRISCNQKHIYNFTKKISYNLSLVYKLIYDNGLIQEFYKLAGNSKSTILFGSYRKGDDTDKSDLDIAVEVSDNKGMRIIELGVLPQFGYRKNVSVNLHIFSRNKVDLNLFNNIANGIVLEGFLEVKK
ncbi:MAG: nucleotidyltransferase domain-containing protein [archaeon]